MYINTFFRNIINNTFTTNSLQLFYQNLHLRSLLYVLWVKVIHNFKKLNTYYIRNEHLWLDGFLFDFLQKKTADIWVRKFVIYTGFLFSERLVFDTVIKLYIDNFVWYAHRFSIFEVSNVFEMLNNIIYLMVTLFFLIILLIIMF